MYKEVLLYYVVASWVIVLLGLLLKRELFRSATNDITNQFENEFQTLRYVANSGFFAGVFVAVLVCFFVLIISPFAIPVFIWRKVKKCMKS